MNLARSFAIRIGVCLVVSWLGWRMGGAYGLGSSLALYGVLLAHPLVELAGELRGRLREEAFRPIEGNFWSYKGRRLTVIEDEQHVRWIKALDVARIIGVTLNHASLEQNHPQGYRRFGELPCFSDETLLLFLAKQSSPEAIRFRNWVEKDIAFPARRLRERLA
jgi:hypothetical protein